MLISHRDDLSVISRDRVEIGDALEERRTLCRGRPRTVVGERQDRDRPALGRENIDALVAVF